MCARFSSRSVLESLSSRFGRKDRAVESLTIEGRLAAWKLCAWCEGLVIPEARRSWISWWLRSELRSLVLRKLTFHLRFLSRCSLT